MNRLERLLDPLMWAWCWLANLATVAIPWGPRGSLRDRAILWLLPFAGFYAYHEPDCGSTWRWSERAR